MREYPKYIIQYLAMGWENKYIFTFSRKLGSLVIIKIKIKKLDGDYKYFSLILRTWIFSENL